MNEIKTDQGTDKTYSYAVALITLAALLIRIYNPIKDGLWADELVSLRYAALPLEKLPEALSRISCHPPLFFLILKFWVYIAGNSEYSLRLLSIIPGILCIPAAASLTKTIFNKESAIFAGLIFAFSPFHLYYSHEVRPYILMCLLILLSYKYFIQSLRSPSVRNICFYGLINLLLIYTHVYGFVTILTQDLYYLFFIKKEVNGFTFRKWIYVRAATAICYLPWFPYFISQAKKPQLWNWIPEQTVTESFYSTFLNFSYFSGTLAAVLFFLLISGLFFIFKLPKNQNRYLILSLCSLILPILIGITASELYRPVFWPRYAMQSFIFTGIISARGLYGILAGVRGKLLFGFIIIAFASFLPIQKYYTEPQRTDWRSAFAFMEDNAGSNEGFINNMPSHLYNYYKKKPVKTYDYRQLYYCIKNSKDNNPRASNFWLITWQTHSESIRIHKLIQDTTAKGHAEILLSKQFHEVTAEKVKLNVPVECLSGQ